MKKVKVFALLLSLALLSTFAIATAAASQGDAVDLDFYAANGIDVNFTDNGVIVTATNSEPHISPVNAEELEFYAADGVVVTATNATEPVDFSNCVVSNPGSKFPPIADEELDFYAADGVVVTVTDATEPVDFSNCIVSDPGSQFPPIAD